jgi:hypothetical protein
LSHGVTEMKGFNLGILNPIYERELNKPDIHQVKGKWVVTFIELAVYSCRL